MTAEELTLEILDRRNVGIRERDYWTCFEVNEREEAGGWPPGLVQSMAWPVPVWAAVPVCPPLPRSVATVVVKGVLDDGCFCHMVISVMVAIVCWQGLR